jgi:hypothetical protein
MRITSKFIFLSIAAFIAISGCTNKHSIGIRNRTAEEITLLEVAVDEKVISQEKVSLKSSPTNFEPNKISYYSLKANNPSKIIMTVKRKNNSLTEKISCQIKDEDGSGCYFKVSIAETKVFCACDPNSDFSD